MISINYDNLATKSAKNAENLERDPCFQIDSTSAADGFQNELLPSIQEEETWELVEICSAGS